MRKVLAAWFTTAMTAFAAPAMAAGDDPLTTLVSTVGLKSTTPEDYVAELARAIRLYDRNGDGLSADELDVLDQLDAAGERARRLATYLTADLDGDFRVSLDEYQRIVALNGAGFADRKPFDLLDTDRNSLITLAEMTAPDAEGRSFQRRRGIEALSIAIDPTPADPFTLADVDALVGALFDAADANGNGRIERDEASALKTADKPNRKPLTDLLFSDNKDQPADKPVGADEGSAGRCALPRPQPGDKVVVLGTYEGDAYANVSLGGPSDSTFAVNVVVEPGGTPLYVIATSYSSVIWQFSGAVERVHRLALSGYDPQGSTGVPASVVSFDADEACFRRSYEFDGFEGEVAKAGFRNFAPGFDITYSGAYAMAGVLAPSGATGPSTAKRTASGLTLAEIDAAAVTANVPVTPYEVLPGVAGLAQLVETGALERIERGAYRIVKPIPHFPAGLFGANSVRFLLGKGVPMPPGNPGHSCVVSEDDGRTLGLDLGCGIAGF